MEVPLLILAVPMLIWWMGRLTPAKVGVDVEAELVNEAIDES